MRIHIYTHIYICVYAYAERTGQSVHSYLARSHSGSASGKHACSNCKLKNDRTQPVVELHGRQSSYTACEPTRCCWSTCGERPSCWRRRWDRWHPHGSLPQQDRFVLQPPPHWPGWQRSLLDREVDWVKVDGAAKQCVGRHKSRTPWCCTSSCRPSTSAGALIGKLL